MRCGIDFGTSNTVLAFMDDATKKAGLVPLENDSFSIPTAIFYPKGNLSPLFGREALETALGGGEGRLVRSLKRALGTSLMEQPLLVNGVRTSFANIVGRFLSHIRQRAEACLGVPVQDVTLGRPVHFQTNDPQADMRAEQQLRKIALDCGFRNIDFRYEPVAAALAHERRLNGEKLALVVDIGGGTSDFSVIRLNRTYARGRDRRQDILANTGMRIGGNDCDKALSLHTAMPLLGMGTHYGSKNLEMPVLVYHDLSEWVRINNCYTPAHLKMVREICVESHAPQRLHLLERVLEEQQGHRVLDVVESLKIGLADRLEQENTTSGRPPETPQDVVRDIAGDLGFLQHGLEVRLERQRMNLLLEPVLEPVHRLMDETLQQAGVSAQQIGLVILTGGSTGLPVFMDRIRARFPHAGLSHGDRLGSVGAGLVL